MRAASRASGEPAGDGIIHWPSRRSDVPSVLSRVENAGARTGVRNSPSRRIWNLRRGDADDNRTSPHGRGWRSVALSTALESNYLTASIAFVALVLVPALLVGLAPPLLLTYGRQKLDAATAIFSQPLAALLSLAVLSGVALWIGRPLLATSIENLWHLHYTLVFPIFVGLRETLSAVIERLPGEMGASSQLDRRRRLGTVLAAMLMAGGGLLLAWRVGVMATPGLADVVMQPWTVAKAGLGNAAIFLGLSTAVASLYWLWREIASVRPLRDWSPGPRPSDGPIVRVAHLSDLHLVGERYGYRMECGTQGPRGNRSVRHALRKLRAIHQSTPIDRVLVTGDVTDAGTRAEWLEFLDLLRCYPDLRSRVLFVPGNHDVNIVDRTNTGRFDIPWSASHALRRLRFVVALDAIQGERVHLVDRGSGELGPSLRSYLQEGERPARLRGLAEHGTWRGRQEMARVWDAIFPLVAPPTERAARDQGMGEDGGCGAILLDSNARSHFSATNAVGVIGRSQLKRLRAILNASPHRAWIILLHHHVVEYPVRSVKLADRIALSLMNASDVMSAIARHASRVVIFHGHRHHDWIGTSGGVVLCSAPSVALGSVGPELYKGSFHVNELVLTGGGLRLASSERVRVS
jgi:3',5'-cyclic AMP phosphodiesterase CpdA